MIAYSVTAERRMCGRAKGRQARTSAAMDELERGFAGRGQP